MDATIIHAPIMTRHAVERNAGCENQRATAHATRGPIRCVSRHASTSFQSNLIRRPNRVQGIA
jgi:hypothetical protein